MAKVLEFSASACAFAAFAAAIRCASFETGFPVGVSGAFAEAELVAFDGRVCPAPDIDGIALVELVAAVAAFRWAARCASFDRGLADTSLLADADEPDSSVICFDCT